MDRFTSSHPTKPDEKEIPAAMLALVSTAVCLPFLSVMFSIIDSSQIYACIDDYRHLTYEAGRFEINEYLHAYKQNISVLNDIKEGAIDAYHDLMHGLFINITYVLSALLYPSTH